ncbi:sensor histidine kinase [Microbacterium sp. che218]|uniref:sensor histidine kinase n=1 Tax=Microbacterium sp. che218 TaxID=3140649 RepID=UPI0033694BC2
MSHTTATPVAASDGADVGLPTTRGWIVAFLAAGILGAGIAVASAVVAGIPWASAVAALTLLGAYTVFILLVLPRLLRREAGTMGALDVVTMVVTVVVVALLTFLVPWLAMLQFWVFPLLWTLAASTRIAVSACFVSAASIFAALLPWTGGGSWAVMAFVQGASFVSAVVLGLWISGISRYGSERDVLVAELTAAQSELASLHHDAGAVAERERLTAEMHDTIAQSLAGTVMLAQRARRELVEGALSPSTLELVEEAARAALAETRELVAGGAPASVGAGGLTEALRTVVARAVRETGLDVELVTSAVPPLDREAEVALLRCAQEGLSNARRHSGARRVEVGLAERHGVVELTVRDDGVGFDATASAHGYGIEGLRARLGALGGSLEVDGTPGAATVRAGVPVRAGRS